MATDPKVPCIGDLKHRVKLLRRVIQPPAQGETDFAERFTEFARPPAKVITPGSGSTFYDGVGNAITVSHEITMRWRSDVDTETWVELGSGDRLRVLSHQNVNETDEWLRLVCSLRGPDSVAAAQA